MASLIRALLALYFQQFSTWALDGSWLEISTLQILYNFDIDESQFYTFLPHYGPIGKAVDLVEGCKY